jgi:S1-C subfamily serine protease
MQNKRYISGRRIGIAAGLAGLLLQISAVSSPGAEYENSVVRVLVTAQHYDAFLPWQKTQTRSRHGYGVVVRDDLIITTENLVRNHTLVQVQKTQSGRKLQAAVEQADAATDLALLRIIDIDDSIELEPMELLDHLDDTASIELVQFDETSAIQHGKADVVNTSVVNLPVAVGSVLSIRVLSDIAVNGEAAVVVSDKKLVGLIMSYDQNTRVGELLPYPILAQFLDDACNPPYKGVPVAGFKWKPLVNPATRAFLSVSAPNRGILVLSTIPGTGADAVLLPEDVILALDGKAIDDMGYYDDPDFGRLMFPHLVRKNHSPGDTVPVDVVRNGVVTNVSLKLSTQNDHFSLVPENIERNPVDFLVEGGFVMRELAGDYLRAYGSSWRSEANTRLLDFYLSQSAYQEGTNSHVLILSQVLPDPINVGYQHFRDEIVTHLNREPVTGISDAFRIADRDGGISRVRLKSVHLDIVLDKAELEEANRRLSTAYGIPSLRRRAAPAK